MMAVYRRITDWNEQIIQEVNNLAENPPSGCDPVTPLEEAEEDHLFMKQDVIDVQDKLKEICSDNNFTELNTPQLIINDIIQELKDAIINGWCGCEPLIERWSVGSYERTATCCSFDRYTEERVDETIWQQPFLDAKEALGQTATEYSDAQQQRCYWHHKAIEFQVELEQLQSELEQLLAAEPQDSAAIVAKQAEIDAKQIELDEAETERDDYKSQAEIAMEAYEGHVAELISALSLADSSCPHISLLDYINAIPNTPWTQTECEGGLDWQPTRGFWSISARQPSGQTDVSISGGFTPLGVPYPSNVYPWTSGGLVKQHMGFVSFDSRYQTRGEAEAWCASLLTEEGYTLDISAFRRIN